MSGLRAENAFCPQGFSNPREKHGALSSHQRLIRPRGVTPLIHQYGETMTVTPREDGPKWLTRAVP